MEQERPQDNQRKKNLLYRFDRLIQPFIPNFNVRAILYLTILFAIVIYTQIWRISSVPVQPKPTDEKQEIVIADENYWDSPAYKEKITNQTVDSFTHELEAWLKGETQEFSKRKFEDILFINGGLTPDTGVDLSVIVPESFNYLENIARARYQYAKEKGFWSEKPALVHLGTIMCDIDDKTEQVTTIELYDWRYASMPKLATFLKTKPDWKMQMGSRIYDVSDPKIEDTEILKSLTPQTQKTGLFSFLIFHDTQNNHISLADDTILEKNGIDARLTLGRISSHWNKQPKLYFLYGQEGCKKINTIPNIHYGDTD